MYISYSNLFSDIENCTEVVRSLPESISFRIRHGTDSPSACMPRLSTHQLSFVVSKTSRDGDWLSPLLYHFNLIIRTVTFAFPSVVLLGRDLASIAHKDWLGYSYSTKATGWKHIGGHYDKSTRGLGCAVELFCLLLDQDITRRDTEYLCVALVDRRSRY
jgi:hypothetical protein